MEDKKKDTTEELEQDSVVVKNKIKFSKIKRRFLKHVWLVRGLLLLLIFSFLGLLIIIASLLLRDTKFAKFTSFARNFAFVSDSNVKTIEGRVNILILGKAGANHEAPDLTDTMIFTSIDSNQKRIDMVSLPRDIWLPDLKAKLNSTYYWGNQKETGGGMVLAKSSVEEIVGKPVHYIVIVDFDGFKKIIDVLGGVEVNVQTAFTDDFFPVPGKEADLCDGDPELRCRYETISFNTGSQMMDGETALKFVRSRNAQGDEGTDLARSARQQLVISAIKDKLLSKEFLLHPKKVLDVWQVVKDSTETDLQTNSLAVIARWAVESRDNINSHVLNEDLLFHPPQSSLYNNLYVFIPQYTNEEGVPSWLEVHKWIEEIWR